MNKFHHKDKAVFEFSKYFENKILKKIEEQYVK
jgi:hypothetical protein